MAKYHERGIALFIFKTFSMKHIVLVLTIATVAALTSCEKDNDEQRCYECDMDQDGTYTDAGCMTEREWRELLDSKTSGDRLRMEVNCRYK